MKNLLLLSIVVIGAAQSPDVVVNVAMALDGNATASDIGWALTAEDGSFQTSVPPGAYTTMSEITDQVTVPGGSGYLFTVKDDSGLGLGPTGSYEVTMDDTFGNYVLAEGSGDFVGEESSSFYIPAFPYEVVSNTTDDSVFSNNTDDFFLPQPSSPAGAPIPSPPPPSGPEVSTIPPNSAMGTSISKLLLGAMVTAGVSLLL
jgi:hypothetical protein